jgi:transposase
MRLDRDDHSDVDSDISKPHRPRRVEVLSVPERRRKWPDERKIAIVAETLEPGIVVSDVARRHDLSPSQLFGWLKQFRNEAQALLDARCPPERPVFAPAVVDTTPVVAHALPALLPSVEPAVIEVPNRGPPEGRRAVPAKDA